jgi:hypothetical protein
VRTLFLLVLIPVAAVGQGVGSDPLCFRIAYDSAQRGALASMFPASLILMPGSERGQVKLPDSLRFSYYRPGFGAASWSYRSGRYSITIEGGESGVSYWLMVRGDSLVGYVRHYTDNASAPEPTMRAIGTRQSCTHPT